MNSTQKRQRMSASSQGDAPVRGDTPYADSPSRSQREHKRKHRSGRQGRERTPSKGAAAAMWRIGLFRHASDEGGDCKPRKNEP